MVLIRGISSNIIDEKNREIAELKDKLEDQRVLKAEILRAGRENKRLESMIEQSLNFEDVDIAD